MEGEDMREFKFRGKTNKGDWVYGWLDFCDGLDAWINEYEKSRTWVKPETVCEYAGLKAKGRYEIFEGDVLSDGCESYIVEWQQGGFWAAGRNLSVPLEEICDECDIIGNIFRED